MDVSRGKILSGLLVGIFSASTAAIFIKLCDAPSLTIATYRLGLASLILFPFALHQRRYKRLLPQRNWVPLFFSGAFLSLHFATWIASLKYTSVASSVVLVTTMPVFCALIAHFFFKEKISAPLAGGIALAVAGTVIICFNDLDISKTSLFGDFLALLGALFGAGYLLLGRAVRRETDLFSYIFPVYSASALLLILLSLLTGAPFTGYTPRTYILFLMLAVIPQLIGHSSFNWALRYLSASMVGLVILGEPVLSTLFAWLILGEGITGLKLLGGLVTFGGIYLAVRYTMRAELKSALVPRMMHRED